MISLKQNLGKAKFNRIGKIISMVVFVVVMVIVNTFLFHDGGKGVSEDFKGNNEKRTDAVVDGKRETFKVAYVIDGDTIKLENGQTVRYIGMDTPETGYGNKAKECFGEEATKKNKELLKGKEVMLVKDVSEVDKYGRILRYVYVNGVFVNDKLVREGFARATNYFPDEKYKNQFKEAEAEARRNKKGLWANDVCH